MIGIESLNDIFVGIVVGSFIAILGGAITLGTAAIGALLVMWSDVKNIKRGALPRVFDRIEKLEKLIGDKK